MTMSEEASATAEHSFETVLYGVEANVATITLNRPDVLNSFNGTMVREFGELWRIIKADPEVHAVVLRAAGERAFCTGLDVRSDDRPEFDEHTPLQFWDPGQDLGPKTNHVYKPVICAINGMAAGGAHYWINESDIVICSDDATFFDPHVTFGMTSAYEPIGLRWRMPLGEVMRWVLMGTDERLTAERAYTLGFVSEVVPAAQLWQRADEIARLIAAKPAAAIQGTVQAVWDSMDHGRSQGQHMAGFYTTIGNPVGMAEVERSAVPKRTPFLR